MTLKLNIFPRAEKDAQHIFEWIRERSPDGAVRWWRAFEEAAKKASRSPLTHGLAPENGDVPYELRQFLFKTRRGRTYRGVFVVVEDEVRVLRVRGPGQPPLDSLEMEGV